MLTLRRGDRLPTVAVLQSFLNQRGGGSEFVEVDGIFGSQTQRALRESESVGGNSPDGILRRDEWNRIIGTRFQVVDSLDLTDFDHPRHAIEDDRDLSPFGSTLVRNYGQSSGTPGVIRSIRAQSSPGRVVLLRMHGHGSPGNMVVSSGIDGNRGSSFNSNYGQGFFRALGSQLRSIFCRYGSVELHGCRIGQGASGHALLQGMANALGVPVSAGLRTQLGGGNTTFRFEGPTRTCCPGGKSLKAWAAENCIVSIA